MRNGRQPCSINQWTWFHSAGKFLGAYTIRLIRLSSGYLANSSNNSELLSVYTKEFESSSNSDYIDTTVTLKSSIVQIIL